MGGVGRIFRATALATSLALAGCGTNPERNNGPQNNNTESGSDITAGVQNAEIEVDYDTKFKSEILDEINSFFSECNGTPKVSTSLAGISEDGTLYKYSAVVTTKNGFGADIKHHITLELSTEVVDNLLEDSIFQQLHGARQEWLSFSVYGGSYSNN